MIVVGGEALMDLVPAPDQGRADGGLPLMLPRRGGGPYNTAVALGRLGAPVAFCSRVSTDAYGTALVEGLQKAGVDTALVQRGPEPTMLAVTAISEEGSAAYTFYHQGTADRLFTAPGSLPPRTRALALGTCSLAIEPTASAYEHMLLRESGRGLFIALDPNIRPNVIPDPDAYRARFRSWLPHLSLLKVSFEDTAWLSGCGADDDSVLDAARAWARTGPARSSSPAAAPDSGRSPPPVTPCTYRPPRARWPTPSGRATRSTRRCSTASTARARCGRKPGSRTTSGANCSPSPPGPRPSPAPGAERTRPTGPNSSTDQEPIDVTASRKGC